MQWECIGKEWLNTDIGDISGNWENEAVLAHGVGALSPNKTSVIASTGGICTGHQDEPENSKYAGLNRISVVDIDKDVVVYKSDGSRIQIQGDDRLKYYQLAYYVAKSTERNEVGSTDEYSWIPSTANNNAIYKEYIRGWIVQHYAEVGMDYQNGGGNKYITEPATNAQDYANKIIKTNVDAIFSTNSTEGEGATQVIETKNIGGEEYTFIGPYNLKHREGKVNDIAEITTREGTIINATQCSTDGRNIKNIESLENYSGDSFYIVYKGTVSSVKSIKLTKKVDLGELIRARIVFASPIGRRTCTECWCLLWTRRYRTIWTTTRSNITRSSWKQNNNHKKRHLNR